MNPKSKSAGPHIGTNMPKNRRIAPTIPMIFKDELMGIKNEGAEDLYKLFIYNMVN